MDEDERLAAGIHNRQSLAEAIRYHRDHGKPICPTHGQHMQCTDAPGHYACPVPRCAHRAKYNRTARTYELYEVDTLRYRCPVCMSANVRNECQVFIVTDPNTGEWFTDFGDLDTRPDESGISSCNDCDFTADRLTDFDSTRPDFGQDPPCVTCEAPQSACECEDDPRPARPWWDAP